MTDFQIPIDGRGRAANRIGARDACPATAVIPARSGSELAECVEVFQTYPAGDALRPGRRRSERANRRSNSRASIVSSVAMRSKLLRPGTGRAPVWKS